VPGLLGSFIKVPEHKSVKNRLHVDVTADDREVEVARLMGLGGSRASDHDEWGAVWTVMADPEGNEFCVASVRRRPDIALLPTSLSPAIRRAQRN
jgi:predicted enzyme related to lactoylglutathione lyase